MMKHLDYRHQDKWALANNTLIPQSPIDIQREQLVPEVDTSLMISLPHDQEVIVKDAPFGIQIYAEGDLQWRGHEYMLNRRSEEHTSELQSPKDLVCRLLLEKKKKM